MKNFIALLLTGFSLACCAQIPCPNTPTVKDYDGNVYNTVQIGAQCWMKENLRTTHYDDGKGIPLGGESDNFEFGAYRLYPNSDIKNVKEYGYLYTVEAAVKGNITEDPYDDEDICPTGWHVPSYKDWKELAICAFQLDADCYGPYGNEYFEEELKELKEFGRVDAPSKGWRVHKIAAKFFAEGYWENNEYLDACITKCSRNISGFSALPAGGASTRERLDTSKMKVVDDYDITEIKYDGIGFYTRESGFDLAAYFLSSTITERGIGYIWMRCDHDELRYRADGDLSGGAAGSIRCIKD